MSVEEQQQIKSQWIPMLFGSALVGLSTGLVMLAVKTIVHDVEHEVLEADPWIIACVLMVGSLATVLIVRYLAGRSPSTTDRYIDQFHNHTDHIDDRHAPGRIAASVTTGASAIPMGLEGPAVYAGAAVATFVKRTVRPLSLVDLHSLLVAGAAAGVAVVFKAPLTGVIFALESPYRRRFVDSSVVPALVGSTVGYLTLIAFKGTEPEFPLPKVDITVGYVFGAVVLGLICGVLARGFAFLVRRAEHFATREPAIVRGLIAGLALVGMFVIGRVLTAENVAVSSGFNASEWALDPSHSIPLLLGVLGLRIVATSIAVGGGMVGGLFVPLLAMGAIVGAVFADVSSIDETTLFVVIGGAAFLGAGYGTPIAAVAFVAEITGMPGFILPGLVAVAAAQVVMSHKTVSPAQTDGSHATAPDEPRTRRDEGTS